MHPRGGNEKNVYVIDDVPSCAYTIQKNRAEGGYKKRGSFVQATCVFLLFVFNIFFCYYFRYKVAPKQDRDPMIKTIYFCWGKKKGRY